MGEKPTHVAHLIDDEKSEGQTHQSRDKSKPAVQPNKSAFGKFKWYSKRSRDEHHPGNSTKPEYQRSRPFQLSPFRPSQVFGFPTDRDAACHFKRP
jgi:hypothetical protein